MHLSPSGFQISLRVLGKLSPFFKKTVADEINWFRLEVKQCGHGPDDHAMLHRLLYGGQRFSKVQVSNIKLSFKVLKKLSTHVAAVSPKSFKLYFGAPLASI